MSAASVSVLVILGCWIAYLYVIHRSSIISNEYFLFLASDSFSFSNNLIDFSILIYLHKKNPFFKDEFQNSIQDDWVFSPYNGPKKVLRINAAYMKKF